MTVAQTKAARRKFRAYYREGPIGQPRYKMKSISRMDRQEQKRRQLQQEMAARSKNKKK